MIKLAASTMIVLAGGLTGLIISHGYAVRPQQLRTIESALQMLETEIAFALTPLPDALRKVGKRAGGCVGEFFFSVGTLLDSDSARSSGETWEAELENLVSQAFLTSMDADILRSFGYTLGVSDREDQIKNLRLVQEQLRHQEAEADKLRDGNQRIWRTIGFLGGLAVVFILY